MSDELVTSKKPRLDTSYGQIYEIKEIVSVHFDENYPIDDYKIFEIPKDISGKFKLGENNIDMKIVGSNDNADSVLCTKNLTFAIKKVETSNGVFIIPPSIDTKFKIRAKCPHYYELLPIRGKTDQLFSLLLPTQYDGPNNSKLLSHTDLLTKPQIERILLASNDEIDEALLKLNVVELNGYLRMLSSDVLSETIRLLLDTIIENNWNIENIDQIECISQLSSPKISLGSDTANDTFSYNDIDNTSSIDDVFILHALGKLGNYLGNNKWKLNEISVAKYTADILFRYRNDNNKLWLADDFLNIWSSRTPGISNPSEKLLEGIAIKELTPKGSYYFYLSVNDLPLDPKSRFAHLYSVRPKYKITELEPYLRDLIGGVGQPKSIPELVLQYSRHGENDFYLPK